MSKSLIQKLCDGDFKLRKSERKVAKWVLENKTEVSALNITTIANNIGVSEPTIVRFSRALGYKGYQEFKIKLAEDLALGTFAEEISLDENDSIKSIKEKVCLFAKSALNAVDDEISNDELEAAIDALISAKQVLICGFGGSSCTAQDAFHKFFRITDKVTCSSDMHIQMMSAGTLQQQDVLIAVSNTGKTEALLELCKIARHNGAKVIAITTEASPVDNIANIHLSARDQEDTSLFMPLVSRLRHLTILDILVMGYALKDKESSGKRLARTKRVLKDLKKDSTDFHPTNIL